MRASSIAPERWNRLSVGEGFARSAQDRRVSCGRDWHTRLLTRAFETAMLDGRGFRDAQAILGCKQLFILATPLLARCYGAICSMSTASRPGTWRRVLAGSMVALGDAINRCVRTLATARYVLAVIVATPMLGAAGLAQGREVLQAIDLTSFARLQTHDPQTGALIRSVLLPTTPVAQADLTWDGSRVLIQGNMNWLMDRLVKCNPADGGTLHLSQVGSPWMLLSIEVDSTVGLVRAIAMDVVTTGDSYFSTIDPASGALTLGPKIVPLGNWVGMAIDSSGSVILAQASGQKYFSLDPTTGIATLLGNTAIQNSICHDLAFDSNDQLWGVFQDASGGPHSGIYRIYLSTFATTLLVPVSNYYGLAFSRDTATQKYCVPKTSSIGCAPTLRADGFASPTAKLGFTIHADNLNNNRTGLLFYTAAGRASTPFQGGLLCVAAPISRSPAANTGGTPPPALDCSGMWSIDYNAMIWAKYGGLQASNVAAQPPYTIPGTAIQCQWWGRDQGFAAPNNSMLSDGLEFVLSP